MAAETGRGMDNYHKGCLSKGVDELKERISGEKNNEAELDVRAHEGRSIRNMASTSLQNSFRHSDKFKHYPDFWKNNNNIKSGNEHSLSIKQLLLQHKTSNLLSPISEVQNKIPLLRLKSENELKGELKQEVLSPRPEMDMQTGSRGPHWEESRHMGTSGPHWEEGRLVASLMTSSRPLDVRKEVERGVSCIMWVHLQASICTEWAHASIVMKAGQDKADKSGKVMAPTQPSNHYKPDLGESVQQKPPRTIHRCILKTSATPLDSAGRGGLECHVCNTSYPNYKQYFSHLIDSTCVKYQEENRISSTRMTIYSSPDDVAQMKLPRSSPQETGSLSMPWENNGQAVPSLFPPNSPKKHQLIPEVASYHLNMATDIPQKTFMKKVDMGSHTAQEIKYLDHSRRSWTESDSDQDIQILSEVNHPEKPYDEEGPRSKKPRLHPLSPSPQPDMVDRNIPHQLREISEVQDLTNKLQGPSGPRSYPPTSIPKLIEKSSIVPSSSSKFDEQAASETLLLLSSSSKIDSSDDNIELSYPFEREEVTATSSVRLKKPLSQSECPSTSQSPNYLEDPVIVASDQGFRLPILCPCEAARRLPKISSKEHAEDVAHFAHFNSKLRRTLLILLGEQRLTQLGHPSIPAAEVLLKVLRLTGTNVTKEDDLCSFSCKIEKELEPQRKYRMMKSRLIALEMNTEAFLKICTPDAEVWEKFGWKGKHVFDIISQIATNGAPKG